ncbi:MAG: hypothetical protein IPL27_23210 [Lewinellaceae bacterium]|nr:hypothetical protein [Lewinellaceae bacterium]
MQLHPRTEEDFFIGLGFHAWEAAFVVKAWPKADTVSQDDFEADIAQFETSFLQVSQRSKQENLSFDDLFSSSLPALKPDKPPSMYEQVFGKKPPTTSKKKKKKKKR